jgi:hypothetical protein
MMMTLAYFCPFAAEDHAFIKSLEEFLEKKDGQTTGNKISLIAKRQ